MEKSKKGRISLSYLIVYGTKVKKGTTSSMWVTSQDNPAVEIIHFERTSLNGLCPNEFFILNRG